MGRFINKGRSTATYQRKVKQLKRLYKNLYKSSTKKKSKSPQGVYFCDKYPTEDSFLAKVNIKKSNQTK